MAGLCLLLVVSLALRIYLSRLPVEQAARGPDEAAQVSVDLGEGVVVAHARIRSGHVRVGSCGEPVSVSFVPASPYTTDPSLVGRSQSGDRVFYVYRGWNLGGRFATLGMNAIYFARRAYARLKLDPSPPADMWVVKIAIRAGCGAALDDVMTVLRREVATGR